MEKKPILMPMRSNARGPVAKPPLIITIGNSRYQLQLETMLTPLRAKHAEVIPIDRAKRRAGCESSQGRTIIW
jgi:hypothetical protein